MAEGGPPALASKGAGGTRYRLGPVQLRHAGQGCQLPDRRQRACGHRHRLLPAELAAASARELDDAAAATPGAAGAAAAPPGAAAGIAARRPAPAFPTAPGIIRNGGWIR